MYSSPAWEISVIGHLSIGAEPAKKGVETYRRGMDAVDPINYVSRAAPASVLFQFSNADKYISRTTATSFYVAASRPKQIRWYDTDHAMDIDACATIDAHG